MLKVAVTGNIGSGKTSVCRVFEALGVPVFYSDLEAKKLYDDPTTLEKITARFGKNILTPFGTLNRKELAAIIFNDKEALRFVTGIIHPLVYVRYKNWLALQQHKPWSIQESALVFETGNYTKFDRIILVSAPDDMVVERVTKRDGSSPEDMRSRMANQMPIESKKEHAHYHILNDNSYLIIPRLLKINEELTSQASGYNHISK
jgi:dephospho-CoA kinase